MRHTDQHQQHRPLPANNREISLEEVDVLVRKCHHLHDEEILQTLSRLYRRWCSAWSAKASPQQEAAQ